MARAASVSARFADDLGRPITRGGLGLGSVWVGGGRVALSLAEHGGIEEIAYFGRQPLHRQGYFRASFRSAYPRVFRAQVLVGGRPYTLSIADGILLAAGWLGKVTIPSEDLELEFTILCTNDAVIQAVRALTNPKRHRLGLRVMLRDYTRVELGDRTWSPWTLEDGVARCSACDDPAPPTHQEELLPGQVNMRYPKDAEADTTRIAVVGDGAVAMRTWRSQLRAFTVERGSATGVGIALVFASGNAAFTAAIAANQGGPAKAAWKAVAALHAADAKAPQPTGYAPLVTSFAKQAPAMIRGLMPADLPGAQRSNYNSYWVWGWDTLFHSHITQLSGLTGEVGHLLDLFGKTAHPEHGVGHAFDGQMRPVLTQPLPAQGLFAIAAYQQWAISGDIAPAKRHWSMMVAWLRKTLTGPSRDGLIVGPSLFPDFPQDAGQNGDDLTAINNGIFHQACRCIEHLAGALGDAEIAAIAAAAASACRDGFRRHIWNPKRGYWHDSVAASTLTPRPSFPAHAIMWVSPFARELVGDAEAAAAFMAKNHRCPGGLRMYPPWDPAFNADGNQLGQYYPPGQDPLYLRLMALTGRHAQMREWLGWVAAFWKTGTVPEGCTLEADNDGPWRPDFPGGRQLFTLKAWYDGLLGAIFGITCDPQGLTIEPGLGGAQSWQALPIHGASWDIAMSGTGDHVASVTVGGVTWAGTCKVPLAIEKKTGKKPPARDIVVVRTAKAPRHPVLRSADGARITASSVNGKHLSVTLAVGATVLARIWASKRPRVSVDGVDSAVGWNAASGIADVWLNAKATAVTVVADLA